MSSSFINNNNTSIQPVRGNRIKAQALKSLGRTLACGASKARAVLRRIVRGGGDPSRDSNCGGDDGGPSSGATPGSTTPSPYDSP